MKTLWDKLKPEYKKRIKYYQECGDYTSGPQNVEKALKEYTFFGELTIDDLKNVFVWTDNCITNIEWQDLFGERFLIKKENEEVPTYYKIHIVNHSVGIFIWFCRT